MPAVAMPAMATRLSLTPPASMSPPRPDPSVPAIRRPIPSWRAIRRPIPSMRTTPRPNGGGRLGGRRPDCLGRRGRLDKLRRRGGRHRAGRRVRPGRDDRSSLLCLLRHHVAARGHLRLAHDCGRASRRGGLPPPRAAETMTPPGAASPAATRRPPTRTPTVRTRAAARPAVLPTIPTATAPAASRAATATTRNLKAPIGGGMPGNGDPDRRLRPTRCRRGRGPPTPATRAPRWPCWAPAPG